MIKLIFLMLISAQLLAQTIELTWTLPELREDGTAIETIDRFNLYQTANDGSQNVYEIDSTSTSFQILDVQEGAYSFQISTVESGQEGAKSPPVPVVVLAPIEIVISKPSYPSLTVKVIE